MVENENRRLGSLGSRDRLFVAEAVHGNFQIRQCIVLNRLAIEVLRNQDCKSCLHGKSLLVPLKAWQAASFSHVMVKRASSSRRGLSTSTKYTLLHLLSS